MKLLFKDQLKKIKFNLFNFISLSVLVILISLTFTAAKTSIYRLEENYQPYLENQQVEHFYFSMSSVDVEYIVEQSGTTAVNLCFELGDDIAFQCLYHMSIGTPQSYNYLNNLINQEIDDHPEIYEPLIDDYVKQLEKTNDFETEKKYFSDVVVDDNLFRFTSRTYEIDIPYLVEGTLPEDDYEIAIFPEYAENNGIEVLDVIDINGTSYTVTGFIYSPDYAFPISYMNSMDLNTDTLVITNQYTIEQLGTYINRIFVGRGDLEQVLDAKTFKEVNETDTSALGKTAQHVSSVRPALGNFRIATLPLEVENAKIMTDGFIFVFIGFMLLLITIFMRRYIEKNKKDTEILTALGYSKTEISLSLMTFPILITFFSIIGFLLGLLVSDSLFGLYSDRYLFPKAEFSIYSDVFIWGTLLPILFINIVSFIFIRISLQRDKKKSPKVKLRAFKYTPIKTVLSSALLLLSISIMIIFGLNGNSMFSSFSETTKLGNNYNEMLLLDYFTNEDLDENYEPLTRLRGKITNINGDDLDKTYGIRIYGIDPTNDVKLLIDNEVENNLLLEDGVIISRYAEYNLGVKVGDVIKFTVQDTEFEFTVVGVNNELIENNMFMSRSVLNTTYSFNSNESDSYYNGLYTTDDNYESESIKDRLNYVQGLDDVIRLLRTSGIIINFILILSIIIGVFVFSLVIINYLFDNRLNIAILKSIGFNNKELNIKYILNLYIVFIITYFSAIPLTRILFDLLLENIIGRLGYILIVDISFLNIVIGFIVLNIVFVITVNYTSKYFDKIQVSEILQQNIK